MDVSALRPPPLVGRERELAILRDRLAARGGRGGLVLIGGAAGTGKTALARVVCAEAADQGARVLVGRRYDRTETPPYGPWIEILALALDAGDHAAAAALDAALVLADACDARHACPDPPTRSDTVRLAR
jgi:predicted ATPase